MASTSNGGPGKGAAEEPEPEPEPEPGDAPPSSSTSTTTTYDPRDYQPPHPDDRGGADGKATKKGAGGKAKAKIKGEGGAKGKDDDTHRCANCDAPDAKSKCMRCCVVYYCNRECQKVRVPLGVGLLG